MSQNTRFDMSPEQALEFAAQLTAEANKVIAARNAKPGAYAYVRGNAWRNQFPINVTVRVGGAQ